MGPLLPPNEATTTAETARPERTQPSKSAERGRDDLTIDMVGALDALQTPPTKRQRKLRTTFQGGDEPTLLLEPDFANGKKQASTAPGMAPPQLPGPSKSAKRKHNELAVDMNNVPNPDKLPSKRARKPRAVFEGGDEPTLLLDADSAPVKNDKKRKRKEPEAVQIKREESMPPPAKRATRAQSVAKAGSVALESSNQRSTRARSATKEASVAPETTESGGKDPKRSAAMKTAWAKRQAEGRNGRHGGAPLASTVAKIVAKKGGK